MINYPIIKRHEDSIEVFLSPPDENPKYLHTEFVLDFNKFHEVIGIEILNLKLEAGENCLEVVEKIIDPKGEGLRYGYDEEADAFYLQITNERSLDQEAVDGILILNKKGHIIALIAHH